MIDWIKTASIYGITGPSECRLQKSRLCIVCDVCGASWDMQYRTKVKEHINAFGDYYTKCKKCLTNTPQYKQNQRDKAHDRYKDASYKKRVGDANRKSLNRPEVRAKLSKSNKLWWSNPDNKKMMHDVMDSISTPERNKRISEKMKIVWQDKEYRDNIISHISARSFRLWQTKSYRDKILAKLDKRWNDESRKLLSCKMKELWQCQLFRDRIIDSINAVSHKISEAAKNTWRNDEYREKMILSIKERWQNNEFRIKMKAVMREILDRPEVRQKLRDISIERWENLEIRSKLLNSVKKVSKPQSLLYSILDDLGVKYFREYNDSQDDPECTIGPYSFDCVIPRDGQKTLLIECHGDYWHSLQKNNGRDKAKETYINKYFSDKYEIKILWEHQMLSKDYAVSCLKQWMGIDKIDVVDFELASVEIRKPSADEYRPLLSKYHYLINAGRSGMVYGAYVGDTLAAVIVYSPPIRQNYDASTVKELSRLCIHPAYQKKNFASWFIGKTLKLLPAEIKTVVSFADSTFNHVGTIYKASNFKLDGEVKPDYWYVNDEGWVMHKKTLYNHAIRMGCKEREYAESHGYIKVWGQKKFRYIYNR